VNREGGGKGKIWARGVVLADAPSTLSLVMSWYKPLEGQDASKATKFVPTDDSKQNRYEVGAQSIIILPCLEWKAQAEGSEDKAHWLLSKDDLRHIQHHLKTTEKAARVAKKQPRSGRGGGGGGGGGAAPSAAAAAAAGGGGGGGGGGKKKTKSTAAKKPDFEGPGAAKRALQDGVTVVDDKESKKKRKEGTK